jgi:hypothetical protein
VQHRREVVEPVYIGWRGVEPDEVVTEPTRVAGGHQIGHTPVERRPRVLDPAPALPREVGQRIVVVSDEVKDAAIKRSVAHFRDVALHERGVGLVPTELNELGTRHGPPLHQVLCGP